MELKGTKTEDNLLTAFAGEAQTDMRYRLFSAVAREEGLWQIARALEEMASNEAAHAALWLRALGEIGATPANLTSAVEGETYEYTEMYRRFAEEAAAEGFPDLAESFLAVAMIEAAHDRQLRELLAALESNRLFRAENGTWRCLDCGYTVTADEAPESCPVCHGPQGKFEGA